MASLLPVDPSLDLTTLDSTGDISIQTVEADTSLAPVPSTDPPHISSWQFTGPDPQLCLTPEKTPKHIQVQRHIPRDKHVHFNVPSSESESSLVENKENIRRSEFSNDAVRCHDSDYHANENEFIDETEIPVRRYAYDLTSDERYDVRREGLKVENHSNRALVREVLKLPENKEIRPKLLQSIDTNGNVIEEEHIFKKPELHSTLRLGAELKKLREMEPKLKPKLEEKLQSVNVQYEKLKKQEEALNIADDLFVGRFTELDVSESIITRKERDIKTKAPRPAAVESTKARNYQEPDIMECWMTSLQTETYSSSLLSYTQPTPSLQGAQYYSVYDHLTAWNI